jgi:hypothetical protein
MSVLNIVELQNVQTSATGISPAGYLSNQLVNIQEMVNYDQKRINVNLISNFDTTPIQFISPVNFSNVDLSINGTSVTASGSSGGVSTLGTTSTAILTVGGSVNALNFTQNSVPTFYITALGAATFTGVVSAQNFITTSDVRLKSEIIPIDNYNAILSSLRGVRFKWNSSGSSDVGLVAQDLLPLLPEAVIEGRDGLQVAYMKVIPVLVEGIKGLQARVASLESALEALKMRGIDE